MQEHMLAGRFQYLKGTFIFYAPWDKIHFLFCGQDSPLVWWTSFTPHVADKFMHFVLVVCAPRDKVHLLFGGQDSLLVWWTSFTPRVSDNPVHFHLSCTSGQHSPAVRCTRCTSCVVDKFHTRSVTCKAAVGVSICKISRNRNRGLRILHTLLKAG